MLRSTRTLVIALALSLAAVVPAAAQPIDMRSPDSRDMATQVSTLDLRSPDAVDRATPPVQVPASEVSSDDSTDWGYYAGGAILLVALAGGAVVLMRRRRTIGATVAH
jgi:MYXO-CTERM domain-containing protein